MSADRFSCSCCRSLLFSTVAGTDVAAAARVYVVCSSIFFSFSGVAVDAPSSPAIAAVPSSSSDYYCY